MASTLIIDSVAERPRYDDAGDHYEEDPVKPIVFGARGAARVAYKPIRTMLTNAKTSSLKTRELRSLELPRLGLDPVLSSKHFLGLFVVESLAPAHGLLFFLFCPVLAKGSARHVYATARATLALTCMRVAQAKSQGPKRVLQRRRRRTPPPKGNK